MAFSITPQYPTGCRLNENPDVSTNIHQQKSQAMRKTPGKKGKFGWTVPDSHSLTIVPNKRDDKPNPIMLGRYIFLMLYDKLNKLFE